MCVCVCGLVCFVNEAYPFGLIHVGVCVCACACVRVCVCDFYLKVCEHLPLKLQLQCVVVSY